MKELNIKVIPKPEFIQAIKQMKEAAQDAVTSCTASCGLDPRLGDSVDNAVD